MRAISTPPAEVLRRPAAPRLVLITSPRYPDDHLVEVTAACARALAPGVFGVQLRDKERPLEAYRVLAARLREVTQGEGARLVLNGRWQLVHDDAVRADGVHLGGDALSVEAVRRTVGASTWITTAAHSDAEVAHAARAGADGALVSPVYPSPGKGPARGLPALRAARLLVRPEFQLYALGGVSVVNARACALAGASGVAVIRALLDARDPAGSARALDEAFGGIGSR